MVLVMLYKINFSVSLDVDLVDEDLHCTSTIEMHSFNRMDVDGIWLGCIVVILTCSTFDLI